MPTPYAPGGGSCEAQLRALAREKLVRNLNQDARAVARLGSQPQAPRCVSS